MDALDEFFHLGCLQKMTKRVVQNGIRVLALYYVLQLSKIIAGVTRGVIRRNKRGTKSNGPAMKKWFQGVYTLWPR